MRTILSHNNLVPLKTHVPLTKNWTCGGRWMNLLDSEDGRTPRAPDNTGKC